MAKEKEIEEIFVDNETYHECHLECLNGFNYWGIEELTQAISSGDLWTCKQVEELISANTERINRLKSDVEAEKIKAKIEVLTYLEDICNEFNNDYKWKTVELLQELTEQLNKLGE